MISILPIGLRERLFYLKDRYTNVYLIDISLINDKPITPDCVVIKPMTRREFNFFSIDFNYDPLRTEEEIFNRCVIWPENCISKIDQHSAGTYTYILNGIYMISGFSLDNVLIDNVNTYRQNAQTLESVIAMFICKAFPTYKPHDIENMCLEEQMKLAAMAEQILGKEIDYNKFLNPEKPKAENKKISKSDARLRLLQRQKEHIDTMQTPEGWESFSSVQQSKDPVTKENLFKNMEKLNSFLNG
jgi:hypothetical protein